MAFTTAAAVALRCVCRPAAGRAFWNGLRHATPLALRQWVGGCAVMDRQTRRCGQSRTAQHGASVARLGLDGAMGRSPFCANSRARRRRGGPANEGESGGDDHPSLILLDNCIRFRQVCIVGQNG